MEDWHPRRGPALSQVSARADRLDLRLPSESYLLHRPQEEPSRSPPSAGEKRWWAPLRANETRPRYLAREPRSSGAQRSQRTLHDYAQIRQTPNKTRHSCRQSSARDARPRWMTQDRQPLNQWFHPQQDKTPATPILDVEFKRSQHGDNDHPLMATIVCTLQKCGRLQPYQSR